MKIPLWKRGMKGDLINKYFALIDFMIDKSPTPSLLKRGIGSLQES
jgi:hypothetical protein